MEVAAPPARPPRVADVPGLGVASWRVRSARSVQYAPSVWLASLPSSELQRRLPAVVLHSLLLPGRPPVGHTPADASPTDVRPVLEAGRCKSVGINSFLISRKRKSTPKSQEISCPSY